MLRLGAGSPFFDVKEPPSRVITRSAELARLGVGFRALSDAGRPRTGRLARRDLTDDDLELVLDAIEDPEDDARPRIERDREGVLLLEWYVTDLALLVKELSLKSLRSLSVTSLR